MFITLQQDKLKERRSSALWGEGSDVTAGPPICGSCEGADAGLWGKYDML